jgi:peptidyl-prolyl cis-trans isomerase D
MNCARHSCWRPSPARFRWRLSASNTSLKQIARLVAQQREIAWADLPASAVASQIKVTPADVEQYYAANKAEFTEPEQIRAEYLVLDIASVAAGITVSDQDVADYYAANAAQFGQPEQRSASHILIAADSNADAATRAQAKAKATELFSILQKAPGRFAELARTESQDPGSAAQDGSLGSFGRGMMVKPFEDAVFSMKPNEIRGPVESDFGYHIIRLDGIQPAQTRRWPRCVMSGGGRVAQAAGAEAGFCRSGRQLQQPGL